MLWQTKTVRTIVLTRFYTITALNTVTDEVISSYDKIMYDIIQPYHTQPPIFTILLVVATLLYIKQKHYYVVQNPRIEKILENETNWIQFVKSIIIIHFLIFWRNIDNAI